MVQSKRGPSTMPLGSILGMEFYIYNVSAFMNFNFTYPQTISGPVNQFINLYLLVFFLFRISLSDY